MVVCFDYSGQPCHFKDTVGVVQCDGFLLWQLPFAPNCGAGYCTAPSNSGGG